MDETQLEPAQRKKQQNIFVHRGLEWTCLGRQRGQEAICTVTTLFENGKLWMAIRPGPPLPAPTLTHHLMHFQPCVLSQAMHTTVFHISKMYMKETVQSRAMSQLAFFVDHLIHYISV